MGNLSVLFMQEEETGSTMEQGFASRIFPRLVASYDNRNDTFSWALMIWVLCAAIFAPFSKLEPTMEGATVFSLGWAAIHVLRRL
jgi:hypothetical protein